MQQLSPAPHSALEVQARQEPFLQTCPDRQSAVVQQEPDRQPPPQHRAGPPSGEEQFASLVHWLQLLPVQAPPSQSALLQQVPVTQAPEQHFAP